MDRHYMFERLRPHIGHKIVCTAYGETMNDLADICIECEDCNCVLVSVETLEFEEENEE